MADTLTNFLAYSLKTNSLSDVSENILQAVGSSNQMKFLAALGTGKIEKSPSTSTPTPKGGSKGEVKIILDYGPKVHLVVGDTKPIKDSILKPFGCKYLQHPKNYDPGWMVYKDKLTDLETKFKANKIKFTKEKVGSSSTPTTSDSTKPRFLKDSSDGEEDEVPEEEVSGELSEALSD